MENYKVTVEFYDEYMRFKSNLLQYLMSHIFVYYQKYIDSGDLIFTGSIIYDRLGIQKKEHIGDIDLSVNSNIIGDEIQNSFISFLSQIDLTGYKKIYKMSFEPKLIENEKTLTFDKIIGIDFFRNEHPKDCKWNVQIFPNVYTKYFGHEWNLDKFIKSYQNIINIENHEKRIAQIIKFKNLFQNYLNVISYNEFKNKELYYNIQKILENNEYYI